MSSEPMFTCTMRHLNECQAERAAIMEYDGGLSREEAEKAALSLLPSPPMDNDSGLPGDGVSIAQTPLWDFAGLKTKLREHGRQLCQDA